MDLRSEIINNFKESCRRHRVWSIVLIIVTLVIFTTFWNSRLLNWNMQTIRYLKVVESYQKDPNSLNSKQNQILERALNKYGEPFVKDYEVQKVIDRLYNQTAPFAYVQLPFLGIKYHINDIGIISGWVFIILLLTSYTSLKRKNESLLMLVDSFKGEEIGKAAIKSQYVQSAFLGHINKLIYVIPALLLLLILANDILSKDLGMMISPFNMNILFVSSVVTVILSMWLAALHVRELQKSDFLAKQIL
ncbi:MAG: hypothetical protein HKN92_12065 [Chitinophagales bacterium]|nr:hypothetical protein [Chitinophagales bacterium]